MAGITLGTDTGRAAHAHPSIELQEVGVAVRSPKPHIKQVLAARVFMEYSELMGRP
jgi:hypothetical protein